MTPAQFKTERERLGFTQETVADLADLSLETIQNFEEGRHVNEKSISKGVDFLTRFKGKIKKQELEIFYFEHFKQACGLRIKTEYTDAPDVIIQHNAMNIGVEITNFYHESGGEPASEQQQRRWRDKLVTLSQKLYKQKDGKNRELTIQFDPDTPLENCNKKIACALADLAISHHHCTESRVISDEDFCKKYPQILSVYYNSENYDDPKWRVNQVYSRPYVSEGAIRKIICDKEEKARNYKNCDEYWLLIVIYEMDSAQDAEIPDNFRLLFAEYCGIYKRVIIYNISLVEKITYIVGPEMI
jgi:transcriptional regulator with XRE-family HTH domain